MPLNTHRHGSQKGDHERASRQYPIEEIIDGVEHKFKKGKGGDHSHREQHERKGEFRRPSHRPKAREDSHPERPHPRPQSHPTKDKPKDFPGQPKIINADGTPDYPNMHTYINLRESCNNLISGYDKLEPRYQDLSDATQRALLRTPNPIERFTIRCVLHPPPLPHVLKIRELYLGELRMANAALKSIVRNEDGKTPSDKERLGTIFAEVTNQLRIATRSLTDITGILVELQRQDKIRRDMGAEKGMSDERKKWRAAQDKALWHEIYGELEKEVPLKEALLGTIRKWEEKKE
ncbi:hypothetical protein BU16DRAFT_557418 [Lophium mytilinum]|uniref:Uncharacterized protein n=1 Tax=Lophium mytilinum TaxID=390894 RepID=A0A6A6R3L6_9PEZI|nr:hypothetical protein BU16DRAFT_557418 [Lophium mytilinum]